MTAWRRHDGHDFPGDPETQVRARYRNGLEVGPFAALLRRWNGWPPPMGKHAFDIVEWCPV